MGKKALVLVIALIGIVASVGLGSFYLLNQQTPPLKSTSSKSMGLVSIHEIKYVSSGGFAQEFVE